MESRTDNRPALSGASGMFSREEHNPKRGLQSRTGAGVPRGTGGQNVSQEVMRDERIGARWARGLPSQVG